MNILRVAVLCGTICVTLVAGMGCDEEDEEISNEYWDERPIRDGNDGRDGSDGSNGSNSEQVGTAHNRCVETTGPSGEFMVVCSEGGTLCVTAFDGAGSGSTRCFNEDGNVSSGAGDSSNDVPDGAGTGDGATEPHNCDCTCDG